MRDIVLVLFTLLTLSASLLGAATAGDLPGVPPETVTDYLHAVIQSDRTFYTIHVVERQQNAGGVAAAEDWRAQQKALPLPAQFLMESAELTMKAGTKFRYRLISLWPINPHNVARNDMERSGLQSLQAHPEKTVTGTFKEGNVTYFQAIYADRAVSQSCAQCHNTHPNSPKKDFKLHDTVGGLVIEIPLER